MLSEKEYEELIFSILISEDPIVTIMNADLDLKPANPNIWESISQIMPKFKEDTRLSNEQSNRYMSIEEMIDIFSGSQWNRDEKIPTELFNIKHFDFYYQKKDEPIETAKDKIPVSLCCGHTLKIMEGLRPLGPSKPEYDFFKSTFYRHKTAAEYKSDLEGSNSSTLDKIFQRAETLRPELKDYYLTQIRAEILNQLRERTDLQIDFQLAFDERMKTENEPESSTRQNPGIRLNRSKLGSKTDLLRILDALYDLRFFNDEEGQLPTKEFVMQAFGEFLGDDFSTFANSLSQSYNNTSLEANLSIFEQLKAKIQSKCLPKT